MYPLKSFDDVRIGDRVDITKTVTEADAALYSAATGDFGPVHFDDGYARGTRFGERIAPGIMVAGIATSVLTSRLVGLLGVSIEDRFWFTGPVRYGDTITVEVWIASKDDAKRTVIWRASARNQAGAEVLGAEATLKFPRRPPNPTGTAAS